MTSSDAKENPQEDLLLASPGSRSAFKALVAFGIQPDSVPAHGNRYSYRRYRRYLLLD